MSGGSMRSACAGDMTCNERNIAGGMEADALKHRRMISKNRNAYVKSEREGGTILTRRHSENTCPRVRQENSGLVRQKVTA